MAHNEPIVVNSMSYYDITTTNSSSTFTYTTTGKYIHFDNPYVNSSSTMSYINLTFTFPYKTILVKNYTKEEFEKLDSYFLNLYLNE